MNIRDILLIEDTPSDAELTLYALETVHLLNRVKVFSDGETFLSHIFGIDKKSLMPILILLDLRLPTMDGIEILSRLKENISTKNIPVIMMASGHDDPLKSKGYQHGVAGFIEKPVEADRLLKALTEAGLYWAVLNKPAE